MRVNQLDIQIFLRRSLGNLSWLLDGKKDISHILVNLVLCAQDNLKELLPLVEGLQDGPQKEKILAKLDIASKAVGQSVAVHDALIPNHVYLAGHAEVSRRDSYLKQLHKFVKPETKKALRAAPLAQPFTFSQVLIDQAKDDIKDKKELYALHRVSESKAPVQRSGRGREANNNNRNRRNFAPVVKKTNAFSDRQQFTPARGGNNTNNRRKRGGANVRGK